MQRELRVKCRRHAENCPCVKSGSLCPLFVVQLPGNLSAAVVVVVVVDLFVA